MVFFAVLLFSACTDYYAPVRDFLDEYTNSAAIGSQSISVPTERDRDGIECVSSDTDVTLTFFLRNPRSYVIDPDFQEISAEIPHTVELSPDRQSITLTFTQADLQSFDNGAPLSGTILLTEIPTGRAFPSWDFTLRCNTPPPRPEGARIMLDTDTNTYVLCFNLDLSNHVHQDDISVVTINNTDYYPTAVRAGSVVHYIEFADNPEFSSTPPGTLIAIPNQPEFVENGTPVYFSTGIPQSAATQNFTITVEDNMGLSRTASTSTADNMLALVMVTDIDGNAPTGGILTLSPYTNGNYQVLLNHTDSSAIIHYEWDGAVNIFTSFPQTLEVSESGTLEVWATRTGYVPSDPVTVDLVCADNQYYVDPDDGNDSPGNGTQGAPFKTIEYAIDQFNDRTDDTNTIFLMGELTLATGVGSTGIVDIIPTEDITFTIDGSEVTPGNATINGENTKRCLHINAQNATVNLTLRNLNIKNGYTSGGGAGINFEAANNGSSLKIEGCVVEGNHVVGGTSGGGVYFLGSELNIDNSQIRSNGIEASVASWGAGIYMEGSGSSATANISSTYDTTEISGNSGEVTGAACMGGGIFARNIDLTISGGTISTNTANSEGPGSGGGIYQASGTLRIESGTIISGNWGTKASFTGTGGGISYYGTSLDIDGAEIYENYASTQGTGWGGGVYVGNTTTDTTTVKLTNVDINSNWASTLAMGYGGGLCVDRISAGSTNITLNGGEITGNTATNSNGRGGGIYIIATPGTVLLKSLQNNNVVISGNRASTSSSAYGYGGGIYVGQGGQVEWYSGTISGNWANQSETGVTNSQGEGVYLTSLDSAQTTFLRFTGGSIVLGGAGNYATHNVVYLKEATVLHLDVDVSFSSAGNIYLESLNNTVSDPTIQPYGVLDALNVAHLVPSDYSRTSPILASNAATNHTKFSVESDMGIPYYINIAGCLNAMSPP